MRWTHIWSFSISSLFWCLIWQDSVDGRFSHFITEGNVAWTTQFPFSTVVRINGEFKCGGSLISSRHVLTAKHCVKNDTVQYSVKLGGNLRVPSIRQEHMAQDTDVIRIIKHGHQDAAILVLKEPLTCNEFVSTIALAPNDPPTGTMLTVMGWGQTEHLNFDSQSDTLRLAAIEMQERTLCEDLEIFEAYDLRFLLCAGKQLARARNACHGDSGGPLITFNEETERNELVGIVHAGKTGCPAEQMMALYLSVHRLKEWILDNTNVDVDGPTSICDADCTEAEVVSPGSCHNGVRQEHVLCRKSSKGCSSQVYCNHLVTCVDPTQPLFQRRRNLPLCEASCTRYTKIRSYVCSASCGGGHQKLEVRCSGQWKSCVRLAYCSMHSCGD